MGKTSIRLFLPLALSVLLHPGIAQADNASSTPHYSLVMSDNDAVCKPLTDLYNELLDQQIQEKRHPKYAKYWTSFEAHQPDHFAAIGFVEPPKKTITMVSPPNDFPSTYTAEVYLADLFDEGKPREISIADQPIGNGSITQITILKKNAEYREVEKDKTSEDIDPEVIDRDGGYKGLYESQKDMPKHNLGYYLTKWPHFSKIYTAFLKEDEARHASQDFNQKIWFPPMISESGVFISTRIFLRDNQPYFILDEYTFSPGRADSNVIVYHLTPSGHEDDCYITLPGVEAAARQRATGGE